MLAFLATLGTFLADHSDLVSLAIQAIEGGVTKATLMSVIEAEIVKQNDAQMRLELDAPK